MFYNAFGKRIILKYNSFLPQKRQEITVKIDYPKDCKKYVK